MKAYQCSRCELLYDSDEFVICCAHIEPTPSRREKGGAEECRKNFKPLKEEDRWHGKFSWEK